MRQNIAAIVAAKRTKDVDVVFFRYDNQLLFYPALDVLLPCITFRESVCKCDKSTRFLPKMTSVLQPAYSLVKTHGEEVCCTFQGFYNILLSVLVANNLMWHTEDLRIAAASNGTFPEPRYDLMHGFWHSQEALITELLRKDMSGLLEAPTRYGKSTLMLNTLRAFPTLPAVLTAPGVDLIKQLYADVMGERGIKGREVRLIGGGKNQKPTYTGINVVSMDSLHKLEAGAIRLVLCDEPHAAPATSRLRQIDRFPYARRYGYGATLKGRSDGKDLLITGLFGPVLACRTYLEAVAEGAICPLHVIFVPVEVTPREYSKLQDAYTDILFENHDVALLIADICNKVIPPDQQTLVFVKTETQADIVADKIGTDPSVAMAKLLTNSERADLVEQVRLNQIKRCLCTRIFVQGVTFPDVRVLINAEAGTGTTSAIQKPGRLAQCRPGKKCGIIIDLQFVPPPGVSIKDYRGEFWVSTINHCKKRRDAYAEKGYTIHDVKNLKELKAKFDSLQ